jgi:hypothetical protein
MRSKRQYSTKSIYAVTAISLLLALLLIIACARPKKDVIAPPQVPYPNEKSALWLQSQIDSSRYTWYLDAKATVSSFCNDYYIAGKVISTKEISIMNNGIFRATAVIQLPDKKITFTLERPYKQLGERSIWQITKFEEQK